MATLRLKRNYFTLPHLPASVNLGFEVLRGIKPEHENSLTKCPFGIEKHVWRWEQCPAAMICINLRAGLSFSAALYCPTHSRSLDTKRFDARCQRRDSQCRCL